MGESIVLDIGKYYSQGKTNRIERFNMSLQRQFLKLKRKVKLQSDVNLESFVQTYFPEEEEEYYFSIPALDRGPLSKSCSIFDNLVVRTKKIIKSVDDQDCNIILMCDIVFKDSILLIVKSIDILNCRVQKHGEELHNCKTYVVTRHSMDNRYGGNFPTRKDINKILQQKSPVNNLFKVLDFLKKWDEYLNFRVASYLYKSRRTVSLLCANIHRMYRISKEIYHSNEKSLKNYVKWKKETEAYGYLLLEKRVPGSYDFPLIELKTCYTVGEKSVADEVYSIIKDANEFSDELITFERNKNRVNLDRLCFQKSSVKDGKCIICLFYQMRPCTDIEEVIHTGAFKKPKYLYYNPIPERALLDRQRRAMEALRKGYVANPFLISYLLEPEYVDCLNTSIQLKTPDWYLEKINKKQKEALVGALNSDGLFLLQGPPGTGKTQVISELTIQLARQGKTVLLTSETHKAIDNVFDRLPHSQEIRAVRLDPSKGTNQCSTERTSLYYIEDIVENYYNNIFEDYQRRIYKYDNADELDQSFETKFSDLEPLIEKYELLYRELYGDPKKYSDEKKEYAICKLKYEQQTSLLNNRVVEYEKNMFILNHLKNPSSEILLLKEAMIEVLKKKIRVYGRELEKQYDITVENLYSLIEAPITKYCSENTFEILLSNISEESQSLVVNKFNSIILEILSCSADEVRVDSRSRDLLGLIKEYQSLVRGELYKLIKEKQKRVIDLEKFIEIYKMNINDLRNKMFSCKAKLDAYGNKELEMDLDRIRDEIQDRLYEIRRGLEYIYDLSDCSYSDQYQKLKDYWYDCKIKYVQNRKRMGTEIPFYKQVSDFVSSKKCLSSDKIKLTRDLVLNANVYGITSKSCTYIDENKIHALSEYGIHSIEPSNLGIDVVIIDEVSKSTFIDLLIPVLYGKSVILVGDQRQLSPVYDYTHLSDAEIESIGKEYITQEKNEMFKTMCTHSFFEQLYQQVPEKMKCMLNLQYRCHSSIMSVFNHFYGGDMNGLQLGVSYQDQLKQHNLTVVVDGIELITPYKHTYFIDTDGVESHYIEYSKSSCNKLEADVIKKVVDEIHKSVLANLENNINFKKPSIGIISLYADQIKCLQDLFKNRNEYSGFSYEKDQRFVIDTVDAFQGDERDIILVSMVGNRDSSKQYDFITNYKRINVAYSRARNLLIIVGNKDFLSSQKVDLSDVLPNDENCNEYPIYEKIINTIAENGSVIKSYKSDEGIAFKKSNINHQYSSL